MMTIGIILVPGFNATILGGSTSIKITSTSKQLWRLEESLGGMLGSVKIPAMRQSKRLLD